MRGFATIALAAHLIERGVADSTVAWLVAVFFLPWTFKVCWGPLVDVLGNRNPLWMGRLVNLAQIGCTSGLGLLSIVSDPAESLPLLTFMIFAICVFVSLQDVAADALAMRSMDSEELPVINSGMRFGQFLGSGVGALATGAGLASIGFSATVVALAAATLSVTIVTSVLLGSLDKVLNTIEPSSDKRAGFAQLIPLVNKSLKRGPVILLLAFGFVASVSDSMIEFSTKPLYLNELNWSAHGFSMYSSWGSFLKAAGAIIAGVFLLQARTPHSRRLAWAGMSISAVLAISLGLFAKLNSTILICYLVGAPIFTSIGWIGFVSLAMQRLKSGLAATKFAVAMAVCNLGTFLGVLAVKPALEYTQLGYSEIIIANGFVILFISTLLILHSQNDDDD